MQDQYLKTVRPICLIVCLMFVRTGFESKKILENLPEIKFHSYVAALYPTGPEGESNVFRYEDGLQGVPKK